MNGSFGLLIKPRFIPARGGDRGKGTGPLSKRALSPHTGIEGALRFLLTPSREDHRFVRSSPAGLSPERSDSRP